MVTNAECEEAHNAILDIDYDIIITEGMLCAGGEVGKDFCSVSKITKIFFIKSTPQGDNGGPLTYKSGSQHVLIGVASWGWGCGGYMGGDNVYEGLYGVFGRISYYREWIERKMTSPSYCASGPDADEEYNENSENYDYLG